MGTEALAVALREVVLNRVATETLIVPSMPEVAERLSLGNVVCFANGVAKLQEIHPGPIDKDDAQSPLMVGRSLLGPEDDVIARLSNGLRGRVSAEAA